MTITGLENNYYLSGNDIWITVGGFSEPVAMMTLTVTNTTTGETLPPFRMYPSPDNDFKFNICVPVRALFPEQDHINNNSLQSFSLAFSATFVNTETSPDETTIEKLFIRGQRTQNANAEWFMNNGDYLIVGKWLNYPHFNLPSGASFINGPTLGNRNPAIQYCMTVRCSPNAKLLKFRNSLGGYQFFAFEKWQKDINVRSGKTIQRITDRLRKDNFRTTENEVQSEIEFYTKTPAAIQDVFFDLVTSPEVYLYHPRGDDNEAKWQRLQPEDNKSFFNNIDKVYENEITFKTR